MTSSLGRYVQQALFRAFLVSAAVLITLFSLLDFVDQLRDVGHGRYGLGDALKYLMLTTPSRFLQLAPAATLFTGLLALGGMANNGELTAIRAAGVPLTRIVAWQLQLGGVLMAVLFLTAEYLIPVAERNAQFDRANLIQGTEVYRSERGLWAAGDHQFLNVSRFVYGVIPADINIYSFDASGEVQKVVHAAQARLLSDGDWQLEDVRSRELAGDGLRASRSDAQLWHSFLSGERVQMMLLAPGSMAPTDLLSYLGELRRQHRETARFEQAFWSMISIPLTMIAMILITPRFVTGSARAVSLGQRIGSGTLLGLALSLLQQIAKQAGLLYHLSLFWSVCLPSLLLLATGLVLLFRARS